MKNRIETLGPKKLVGLYLEMSLSRNNTSELWQKFMPRRNEIKNRVTADYFSMQVYANGLGDLFAPNTFFTKWAAVEVSTHEFIPSQMLPYELNGGVYAVFVHQGPAHLFPKTMSYILNRWLPGSNYELDDREFFEILQEDYNPIHLDAREEVWIPVKYKT